MMIKTRRTLRIERPVSQDVATIVLIEYEWRENDDGTVSDTVGRVLTENGWRTFHAYDLLGPSLPTINGLDMVKQRDMERVFSDCEQRLADLLGAERK